MDAPTTKNGPTSGSADRPFPREVCGRVKLRELPSCRNWPCTAHIGGLRAFQFRCPRRSYGRLTLVQGELAGISVPPDDGGEV